MCVCVCVCVWACVFNLTKIDSVPAYIVSLCMLLHKSVGSLDAFEPAVRKRINVASTPIPPIPASSSLSLSLSPPSHVSDEPLHPDYVAAAAVQEAADHVQLVELYISTVLNTETPSAGVGESSAAAGEKEEENDGGGRYQQDQYRDGGDCSISANEPMPTPKNISKALISTTEAAIQIVHGAALSPGAKIRLIDRLHRQSATSAAVAAAVEVAEAMAAAAAAAGEASTSNGTGNGASSGGSGNYGAGSSIDGAVPVRAPRAAGAPSDTRQGDINGSNGSSSNGSPAGWAKDTVQSIRRLAFRAAFMIRNLLEGNAASSSPNHQYAAALIFGGGLVAIMTALLKIIQWLRAPGGKGASTPSRSSFCCCFWVAQRNSYISPTSSPHDTSITSFCSVYEHG